MELGVNNLFIQFYCLVVSMNFVCEVISDLNYKINVYFWEVNNFFEVVRIFIFSDGQCCVKER